VTREVDVRAFGAFGPQAPSFRVRTRIPSPELRHYGLHVLHHPLLDESQNAAFQRGNPGRRLQVAVAARRRVRREILTSPAWEVTLIQRQIDFFPSARLERLASEGRRLVLDVDDAIWLDSRREAGGHPLAALKGTARKVRWLAERADAVIAGNDHLAEWLAAHSDHVVVIPSLVEHRDIPVRTHEPRDRVLLGWLGSPSTARSLLQVVRPLTEVAAATQVPIELLVVGGDAPAVPGVAVRGEPWSEASERGFLARVDVGLMPLPDNDWTRGKCAYKGLQYMAAGIPVVADDVGVSATVIGHGQCGLMATSEGGWVEHLVALVEDAGLRAQLGGEGRSRVEQGYSVEAWAPRLAAALRG